MSLVSVACNGIRFGSLALLPSEQSFAHAEDHAGDEDLDVPVFLQDAIILISRGCQGARST